VAFTFASGGRAVVAAATAAAAMPETTTADSSVFERRFMGVPGMAKTYEQTRSTPTL
jgi:hypothetical protein